MGPTRQSIDVGYQATDPSGSDPNILFSSDNIHNDNLSYFTGRINGRGPFVRRPLQIQDSLCVLDRDNKAAQHIQEAFRQRRYRRWNIYCETEFPYYRFPLNGFDAKKFTGCTPFDCGARGLEPMHVYPSFFEGDTGPELRPVFHDGHTDYCTCIPHTCV